jgi:hypothetical protein
LLFFSAFTALFGSSGLAAPPAASAPASRPENVRQFQPGIRIDWTRREVLAEATVLMREGLIELFACSPQQREHEALVRLEARPLHLYHALGLIGLQPGHPLRMNEQTEKFEPAVGAPLEIDVRWMRSGSTVQERIENWLHVAQSKRTPSRMPWIFAGSVKTEGGFAADFEGTVIALVDFSSSLIALPEAHSSSNEELWLEPATARIPPVGTKVTLVFRAGPTRITLDAAGRIALDGERVTRAQLAARLSTALKQNPGLRVHVSAEAGCPATEQEGVRQLIRLLGVEDANVTTSRPAASAQSLHDRDALEDWLRQIFAPQSEPTSRPSEIPSSSHHLVSDLRERGFLLRARTQHVAEYLSAASSQVRTFFAAEPQTPQRPKK